MDVNDECRKLIARYLKENGFSKTLAAFEVEAPKPTSSNGPFDSISLSDVVDLLLQQQDLARKLSAVTLSDPVNQAKPFDWHVGIASPLPQNVTRTLRDVHLSSILSVTFTHLSQRVFDTSTASYISKHIPCVATSSTDKRIVFTSTDTWEVVDTYEPATSATLVTKFNPVYPYLMLSGAMNGATTVTNLLTREATNFRNHTKYVVRVAWSDDGLWFATLSYDKTVCLYEVVPDQTNNEADADSLDTDEYASIPTFKYHLRWQKTVPTNPEACIFSPDSKYLIFSRRDDNHLCYVTLPQHSRISDRVYKDAEMPITLLNLNENADSHISFSILSIGVHPSKQALTLQTDTDISRIILVPFHSNTRLRHLLYTGAEQSAYSNPRHAWLEDGSGVAVSSDDGIIRIVDLNGKVKVSMGAHGIAAPQEQEPVPIVGEALRARYQADRGSSVVRDICVIPGNRIVSVGLDKTVRVAEVQ